jgi:hypothetical protein
MSQPSTTAFNVREDLSLPIHEFDHAMNEAGYVAHKLLPIIPRNNKSGKMPRFPLEEELQDFETKRNPDGSFNRSKATWEDDNYDTQSHGLEAVIDDETQARYDDIIDAEAYEGNRIERSLLRGYERDVVDYFTTHTNYTAGREIASIVAWTLANAATAVPYTVIDTQREAMFLELGQEPNALILNRADFRAMMAANQIVDRLKSQNYQDARPGPLVRNADAAAQSLDIEMVIVANALRNTKAPGGGRSLGRIWPTGRAVLARVAVTDDPTEVCIGRTMMWSPFGATDGDRLGVIAESYDEIQTAGSVQRRRTNWGKKILHVEAARLLRIDGSAHS